MLKYTIMIVDDDSEFLAELDEMLTLSGYNTIAVSNGDAALKMVQKTKVDVILLDLKMNGKSGFRVAKELKDSPQTLDIPVIAMTGFYTDKEYSILMNICGLQECLIKLFNPSDMISQIERALFRKEKGEEILKA